MPRSSASKAQRAAYGRAWRAAHRSYHPAWSRTHRETENARKARLRAIPGWRSAHEPYVPVVQAPIPFLHVGHPLFDRARALVPSHSTLTTLHDPLVEDLRSEAVLALLEGRDPVEAVRRYRFAELAWGHVTCELGEWL